MYGIPVDVLGLPRLTFVLPCSPSYCFLTLYYATSCVILWTW